MEPAFSTASVDNTTPSRVTMSLTCHDRVINSVSFDASACRHPDLEQSLLGCFVDNSTPTRVTMSLTCHDNGVSFNASTCRLNNIGDNSTPTRFIVLVVLQLMHLPAGTLICNSHCSTTLGTTAHQHVSACH
jgi:hypothetical protein